MVVAAVVAFTAHNVIAADIARPEVEARLDLADLGAPISAPFLTWLGQRVGAAPGVLDCVLVRYGTGGSAGWAAGPDHLALVPRPDLAAHPRAARARRLRAGVAIYADPDARGLVMLGRGLAGRREVSFEVASEHRGAGLGRRLVAAALTLLPANEPVFAQASPGNAASLRALLAAGFRPIGSEVLFVRS